MPREKRKKTLFIFYILGIPRTFFTSWGLRLSFDASLAPRWAAPHAVLIRCAGYVKILF